MGTCHQVNLSHYSSGLLTIESLEDRGQSFVPYFKPIGFWVSVKGEDDWESWCKSEDFGGIDNLYEHAVTLAPDANILYLRSAKEIRKFTKDYQIKDTVLNYPIWSLVAFYYDGIIIAPYIWECRLGLQTGWYYSWDCASGCIWNIKAIAKIECIKAPMESKALSLKSNES